MRFLKTLLPLAAALLIGAPAVAQTAGLPKAFVPSICDGATSTLAAVCMNDGNGAKLPIIQFNPQTHGLVSIPQAPLGNAGSVPNLSALKLLSQTVMPTYMQRQGYASPGLGGAMNYVYSSAPCPYPDDGAQITASDGKCWLADIPASGASIALWGAKCDSTGAAGNGTDDTTAIQAAFNWSSRTGRKIVIPASTSTVCRVTAPLLDPQHIILFGEGAQPYGLTNVLGTARGPGSWLFFDHLGQGIVIGGQIANYQSTGTILADFGTVRAQPAPPAGTDGAGAGATWTPIDADFDIVQNSDEVTLRNVMTLNPTRQLLVKSGRFTGDGLRGQPFKAGVRVLYSQDTFRLSHTHQWTFWANNAAVNAYTMANREDLLMQRADDPIIEDFFAIYGKNCIHFQAAPDGTVTQGFTGNIVTCDASGSKGVYVDNAPGTKFSISQLGTGNGAPPAGESNAVYIDANSAGTVGFLSQPVNGGFSGASYKVLSGTLTVTDPYVPLWNTNAGGVAVAAAPIFYPGPNGQIYVNGHLHNGGPVNGGGLFDGTLANLHLPMHMNAATGLAEADFSVLTGIDATSAQITIAQGATASLPITATGNGSFTLANTATGEVATAAIGGTGIMLSASSGGSGTVTNGVSNATPGSGTFMALVPGPDSSSQGYTPSGKISIYYSQTQSKYVIYNNKGSAVTLRYSAMITSR